MTSLQLAVSSMGLAVLTLGVFGGVARRSLVTTRSLICLFVMVWLQSPAYSGLQAGTATITAGQPTVDATDAMALLVNMTSYPVNVEILKKYTPAQKAAEIAKAIDAAKIPGVKTAVNNNVVTITGATKFAYFDNSEETGLKLASAGPATNNGVIVTLGYTGTPSEDDASYVAAFGDSAFTDTASIVFAEPPSLDTLLGEIYADLKANLSTGLQSRLTLDLSSDTIAFTFPSSSDQFVQNYTSDGELTANQSIQGVVPEPSTWAMLLIGFAGLAFAGRAGVRPTGRECDLPRARRRGVRRRNGRSRRRRSLGGDVRGGGGESIAPVSPLLEEGVQGLSLRCPPVRHQACIRSERIAI